MPKLTYMPGPHDTDETVSGGVTFRAYEAVDVVDRDLFAKLRRNPFFTENESDQDRKRQWETLRKAQTQAAKLRAHADALERDPSLLAEDSQKSETK